MPLVTFFKDYFYWPLRKIAEPRNQGLSLHWFLTSSYECLYNRGINYAIIDIILPKDSSSCSREVRTSDYCMTRSTS